MKKILLLLFFSVSLLHAGEYKVKVKGHHAGKAKLEITTTQKAYSVELTLYPSMMAKMFGIDDMRDTSKGIIQGGHFYPKTYRRNTLKGNSLFAVDFLKNQAKQTNKGKTTTITVNPKGQDPLAQIAQIQSDLQGNNVGLNYYLITEKSQRLYLAKTQKTKDGNLVILSESPKANRIIRLWFSRDGVLQRMQKEKRGKIQFDMTK